MGTTKTDKLGPPTAGGPTDEEILELMSENIFQIVEDEASRKAIFSLDAKDGVSSGYPYEIIFKIANYELGKFMATDNSEGAIQGGAKFYVDAVIQSTYGFSIPYPNSFNVDDTGYMSVQTVDCYGSIYSGGDISGGQVNCDDVIALNDISAENIYAASNGKVEAGNVSAYYKYHSELNYIDPSANQNIFCSTNFVFSYGSGTFNLIDRTDWNVGDHIEIKVVDACTFKHMYTADGNNIPMYFDAAVDKVAAAGTKLEFVLESAFGLRWRQI